VVIIGAGPYGLTVGAALKEAGLNPLIIGKAMDTWEKMPEGMFLRSRISHRFDPFGDGSFPLFLDAHHLPIYEPTVAPPVPRSLFLSYAQWWMQSHHLTVTEDVVTHLTHDIHTFHITCTSGARYEADAVIIASGIQPFAHMPDTVPTSLIERGAALHTRDAHAIDLYKNLRVGIIGGRQAGFEWAALLCDSGAREVHLTYRHATPVFAYPDWSWLRDIIDGTSADRAWFRQLSIEEQAAVRTKLWQEARLKVEPWVETRLQPSVVTLYPQSTVESVVDRKRDILLTIRDDSEARAVPIDTLICATGYTPHIARLTFIDTTLKDKIDTHNGALPVLSEAFETSVPGLYVVGALAERDFGPLVGFMNMCGVSARILAQHFSRLSTA
jgi:thioredoxin reductase